MRILRIAALLTLLLVLVPAAAWAGSGDEAAKIEGYVRAYLDLVTQRSAKSPDLAQIRKLYGALVPVLQEADRIVPGLKAEADAYLALAESATVKGPQIQGVEKTLQLAFVVLMQKNLDAMESRHNDSAGALESLQLVRALYGGIENTAKRRGGELGSVNLLHDQMVYALGFLEKAAKSRAAGDLAKGRQAVDDLVVRIYFLSVLYELDGIAANRGKDEVVTAEKQVEGRIFFRIIRTVAKEVKFGREIEAELAKPPSEMDLKMARQWLGASFPQLAAEYKGKF